MSFGRAGHQGDQIFHASGAKPWHYTAESALSQLQIHCVTQLLLTPRIICQRSDQLNLKTYVLIPREDDNSFLFSLVLFVFLVIRNESNANRIQRGKMIMPDITICCTSLSQADKPTALRWECRHFDHSANPTWKPSSLLASLPQISFFSFFLFF